MRRGVAWTEGLRQRGVAVGVKFAPQSNGELVIREMLGQLRQTHKLDLGEVGAHVTSILYPSFPLQPCLAVGMSSEWVSPTWEHRQRTPSSVGEGSH